MTWDEVLDEVAAILEEKATVLEPLDGVSPRVYWRFMARSAIAGFQRLRIEGLLNERP